MSKTRVKINGYMYLDNGITLDDATGYVDGYVYGYISENRLERNKGAIAIVVLDEEGILVEVPIWQLSRLEEK